MTGRFESKHRDGYVALISKGERPVHAAAKLGFTLATVKKHLREDDAFAHRVELRPRQQLPSLKA